MLTSLISAQDVIDELVAGTVDQLSNEISQHITNALLSGLNDDARPSHRLVSLCRNLGAEFL